MLNLNLPTLIARGITLVIAFTVHELAHAWVADWLGDDTPRLNGRLTLNPLAHLDPFGTLLLLVAGFGYAKPTPVNPYALRRRTPAGMMLVAAAGPISNLLLAVFAAVPVRLGLITLSPFATSRILPSISFLLFQFIFLNILLLFFNLIPLYPLDGEQVAEYFLPPAGKEILFRMRRYGPMIFMGLIMLGFMGLNIFSFLIVPPTMFVFNLLVF